MNRSYIKLFLKEKQPYPVRTPWTKVRVMSAFVFHPYSTPSCFDYNQADMSISFDGSDDVITAINSIKEEHKNKYRIISSQQLIMNGAPRKNAS